MEKHKVVPREAWLAARREHLAKEKELTRLRKSACSARSNPRRRRPELS